MNIEGNIRVNLILSSSPGEDIPKPAIADLENATCFPPQSVLCLISCPNAVVTEVEGPTKLLTN